MCLAFISNNKYESVEIEAVKLFRVEDGKLYSMYQGKNKEYPIGVELDSLSFDCEPNKAIGCDYSEESYPTGFHAYGSYHKNFILNNKHRSGIKLFLVKLSDIVAFGVNDFFTNIDEQVYLKTWVGKKMTIVKEVANVY